MHILDTELFELSADLVEAGFPCPDGSEYWVVNMLFLSDEEVFVLDECGYVVQMGGKKIFFHIISMKILYFFIFPQAF